MCLLRYRLAWVVVAIAGLSAGCGEDAPSWESYSAQGEEDASASVECPVGILGCPCNDDGACMSGLACRDGTCEEPEEDTGDTDDEGGPNCEDACVSFDECSARGIPILGGTCADTEEVCCNVDADDPDHR